MLEIKKEEEKRMLARNESYGILIHTYDTFTIILFTHCLCIKAYLQGYESITVLYSVVKVVPLVNMFTR